jgi:hypothetical protein
MFMSEAFDSDDDAGSVEPIRNARSVGIALPRIRVDHGRVVAVQAGVVEGVEDEA